VVADAELAVEKFEYLGDGEGFYSKKEVEQSTPDPGPVPGEVILQAPLNDGPDLLGRSHKKVITAMFI
jgi:hypothetical protein